MKSSRCVPIVLTALKPVFAATILLAGTAQAAPQGTGTSKDIAVLDRTLSFRLPASFVEVTNRNNGTNVLIEYVPRGETVANWTRMVTVQAYRGLGASPRSTADISRQAFYPATCKIGPIYHDGGEKVWVKDIKRSVIANGCASLPAGAYPKSLKGAGEQDFIYIFRDAATIYTLNYAIRGKPFVGKAPPIDATSGAKILQDILGTVEF